MFDATHYSDTPAATDAARVITHKQKTLKSAIGCSGIGLHSGKKISMTLKPAPIGTGIVFNRIDAAADGKNSIIPARFDHVVDTQLCTMIGNSDGLTVGTIEHLMAAICGMGIDNMIIDIDGPETPVMDGSAAPFVFLIECAGTMTQDAPRRAIKILEPVRYEDDKGITAEFLPSDDAFDVRFDIDFPTPIIGKQSIDVSLPVLETNEDSPFRSELSSARTFGFLEQVEYLNKIGLALGGSLDNAVVISGNKIMNEEGLRFDDECVRHKAMDAVGDLYLAGAPIIGTFHGSRSGHAHSNLLLRKLFETPSAWTWVELDDYQATRETAWQHQVLSA